MTLKEIYEKYKHLDKIACSAPELYEGKIEYAGDYTRALMLKECWEAIKSHLAKMG